MPPPGDGTLACSLVLATVDRTEEPARLLESLLAQSLRPAELVVVDQNEDDRLGPLVADYAREAPVVRIRSGRGLSRARNAGLAHVGGDVVAFPDDDCWYPPDLLARVAARLGDDPGVDGLTGRAAIDGLGPGPGVARFDDGGGALDRRTAWTRAISYTIFVRRRVVEAVGPFDESLGVGADTPWWSGEDTDYVLRAIGAGFRLHYDPTVAVPHPAPPSQPELTTRAYRYGLGAGRVWRKHRYPLPFVVRALARPLGGALLAELRGKPDDRRYYLSSARGRWQGWTSR